MLTACTAKHDALHQMRVRSYLKHKLSGSSAWGHDAQRCAWPCHVPKAATRCRQRDGNSSLRPMLPGARHNRDLDDGPRTLSFFIVIFRLAGFQNFSPCWPLPPVLPPLPPRPRLPAPCPPLSALLTGTASVLPFAAPFFCALPRKGCCRPLFSASTACTIESTRQSCYAFVHLARRAISEEPLSCCRS